MFGYKYHDIILNGVRGSLVSSQRIVRAQVVVDVQGETQYIDYRVMQRQLRSQLEYWTYMTTI
jgi:hypothetical protein